SIVVFCFQAEDGIRDRNVTGVQTCALPIWAEISDIYNAVMDSVDAVCLNKETSLGNHPVESVQMMTNIIEVAEEELDYGKILREIGRASCREREKMWVAAV